MEECKDKTKDYGLSMVRFVALLMVIGCHSFEWIGYTLGESNTLGILGNYLANGVQIFLLISGILYGNRKDLFVREKRLSFVWRNIRKILLDYYVYIFFFAVPVYIFLKPENIKGIVRIFKVITCSGTIDGIQHLWFIPYILLCYILTPFLYDVKANMLRGGVCIHNFYACHQLNDAGNSGIFI